MINLSRNQDVPFEWEIRPGVPKVQSEQASTKKTGFKVTRTINIFSLRKLGMPPARLVYVPLSPKASSRSFWLAFRIRSDVWQFSWLEIMTSGGCFSSPYSLLRRKESSKRETAVESDYVAELETPAQSSVSSQKSLVSMLSPSSSDVEWAGLWVVLNGP